MLVLKNIILLVTFLVEFWTGLVGEEVIPLECLSPVQDLHTTSEDHMVPLVSSIVRITAWTLCSI